MRNNIKHKVYLDVNVYNELLNNGGSADLIKREGLEYYVSVAHAEELYRMMKNDSEKKNTDKINILMSIISDSIAGVIVNGDPNGELYIESNLLPAMYRVYKQDTIDVIKQRGVEQHDVVAERVKQLRELDASVLNYSNLSSKDIWNAKYVSEQLNNYEEQRLKYNENLPIIMKILVDSGSTIEQAIRSIQPINTPLTKGCYPEICKKSRELLFYISGLFEILDNCGYNKDKEVRKTVSGSYDIQHSICATYCDILVTNDKRFLKRVSAVYYYLGVPTKVMDFAEFRKNYLDTDE